MENTNENDDLLNEIFQGDEEIDYDLIMQNFGLDMNMLDEVLNSDFKKLQLPYIKMDESVKDLTFVYETDSGFDLYSVEEKTIKPFGRDIFSTGVKLNIPEHYEIQVRSKSGLALNDGLMVLNSPGTVDQGYTGEIRVILFNTSDKQITIKKGQKIAQAVLCPVVCGKWIDLKEVGKIENKDRSENGFGSTGLI
jgi:dUTP pyrophosphatase